MASGKLSPAPVFLDFRVCQRVVVGGNLRFKSQLLVFQSFLLEQFVQNCGQGIRVASSRLLLKIRETRRGKGKGAPLLVRLVGTRHNTLYHTMGRINRNALARSRLADGLRVVPGLNNRGEDSRASRDGSGRPSLHKPGETRLRNYFVLDFY